MAFDAILQQVTVSKDDFHKSNKRFNAKTKIVRSGNDKALALCGAWDDIGQLSDSDICFFLNLVDEMFRTAVILMSFSLCAITGRNSPHPNNVCAIVMSVTLFISLHNKVQL